MSRKLQEPNVVLPSKVAAETPGKKSFARRAGSAISLLVENVSKAGRLVARLGKESADEELMSLYQMRSRAVGKCISALDNPNPKIRSRAIMLLSFIGDDRAVRPLAKMLADHNDDVQSDAIVALCYWEKNSVKKEILCALDSADSRVRKAAEKVFEHIEPEIHRQNTGETRIRAVRTNHDDDISAFGIEEAWKIRKHAFNLPIRILSADSFKELFSS